MTSVSYRILMNYSKRVSFSSTKIPAVQHIGSTQGPHLFRNPQFHTENPSVSPPAQLHTKNLSSTPKTLQVNTETSSELNGVLN